MICWQTLLKKRGSVCRSGLVCWARNSQPFGSCILGSDQPSFFFECLPPHTKLLTLEMFKQTSSCLIFQLHAQTKQTIGRFRKLIFGLTRHLFLNAPSWYRKLDLLDMQDSRFFKNRSGVTSHIWLMLFKYIASFKLLLNTSCNWFHTEYC